MPAKHIPNSELRAYTSPIASPPDRSVDARRLRRYSGEDMEQRGSPGRGSETGRRSFTISEPLAHPVIEMGEGGRAEDRHEEVEDRHRQGHRHQAAGDPYL